MARTFKKQRGIFERPARSGIWWICYFDQFGRKHREKVGMKSAAQRVYQQRKTEIRQGKFQPDDVQRKHQNASLGQIMDDYLLASESAGLRALKDIRIRANYWKSLWPERAAKSIVPQDIENARLKLAGNRLKSNGHQTKPNGGRSVATVNRYLATLKAAFMLAVRNGKVEKNPVCSVRLPKENNKRVRWLTDEEEARLLASVPADYHPLVLLALHTGMRKSEQLTLRWENIDFQQRSILIPKTKSGEARRVPMNDVVLRTLQSLPRMLHNPYVFYGRNPGEYLKNGIKNTDWKRYLKEARIQDLKWHDLRHTFASRLVMRGVDLYTVSKLLGHASLEVTERYAHLASGHLQRAVDCLGPVSSQVTPKLTPGQAAIS